MGRFRPSSFSLDDAKLFSIRRTRMITSRGIVHNEVFVTCS